MQLHYSRGAVALDYTRGTHNFALYLQLHYTRGKRLKSLLYNSTGAVAFH